MANGRDAQKSYEQGLRNGKTDATLQGIAESIDRIWDFLHDLPCVAHTEDIGALKQASRDRWALMILALSGLGGIVGIILAVT